MKFNLYISFFIFKIDTNNNNKHKQQTTTNNNNNNNNNNNMKVTVRETFPGARKGFVMGDSESDEDVVSDESDGKEYYKPPSRQQRWEREDARIAFYYKPRWEREDAWREECRVANHVAGGVCFRPPLPLHDDETASSKKAVIAAIGRSLAPVFLAVDSEAAIANSYSWAYGLRDLDPTQRDGINYWVKKCIERLLFMLRKEIVRPDVILIYDLKQVNQKMPFMTGYEAAIGDDAPVATSLTPANVKRMVIALQSLLMNLEYNVINY